MSMKYNVGDKFRMSLPNNGKTFVITAKNEPRKYYTIVKSDIPNHSLRITAKVLERLTSITYKQITNE